mgnify:CR=1 FL=1
MDERTSQAVFNYWNEVRGIRLAPSRFEIEPSRITAFLPETFILEREGRGAYIFRLAGTRICEQFGREFRGCNLMDLWTPEDREILVRLVETVTREGAVGLVTLTASRTNGRTAAFEMLLLPLIHNGHEINRIMGALASSEATAGQPPFAAVRIDNFKLIWPDGRPHAVISRMDNQQPFSRAPEHSRIVRSERRSFRVYDGGRPKDDSAS